MTLDYSLNENDFLQHQLYIASKSNRIKLKRRKSWAIASFAIFFVGILFFINGNIIMTYSSLVFLIYTMCFYPLHLKSHYKKHYKIFIADAYKNRLGITARLNFSDNYIETFDKTGESKINITEIGEIVETGEYIYLRLKIGDNLIIPKLKIENIDILRKKLMQLADKMNINFVSELNWKWK